MTDQANSAPTGDNASASAQDKNATPGSSKSLSDLLDEFDSKGQGTDDSKSGSENEIEELKSQIAALQQEAANRAYQSEMERIIVPALKGDLDVDDELVEYWVNKRADEDSRLMELWKSRDSKKHQFNEAIAALAPEFQEYAKSKLKIASDEAEETETGDLAAAVRRANMESSAKGIGSQSTDFSNLSKAEFAMKEAEIFRLAKAGKL